MIFVNYRTLAGTLRGDSRSVGGGITEGVDGVNGYWGRCSTHLQAFKGEIYLAQPSYFCCFSHIVAVISLCNCANLSIIFCWFLQWGDFAEKIPKKQKEAESGSPACRLFMRLVAEFVLQDEKNFVPALKILQRRARAVLSTAELEGTTEDMQPIEEPIEGEKEAQKRKRSKRRMKGDALYFLAKLMEEALGVVKDMKTAVQLYEEAVALGHDVAACTLGVIMNSGKGVRKDERRAKELYEISARLGNPAAQNNLGLMYENGTGVEQDYAKAAEWYARAAGR